MDAVTERATCDGFAALTVDAVLDTAGVSRTSFYQYFTSLDDCFLEAYRQLADRLLADAQTAAGRGDGNGVHALRALFALARERPDIALFLTIEGLSAGERGFAERDRLIDALSRLISTSREIQRTELPVQAVVGGILRFIAWRVAAEERVGDEIRRDVNDWLSTFAMRDAPARGVLGLCPVDANPSIAGGLRADTVRRLAGLPRARILRATAQIVAAMGLRDATVSSIATAACVSRRVFYNHFTGKEDAFRILTEDTFDRLIAACAPAYFNHPTWPERVWQSGLEFTRFFSRDPVLARFAFLHCYSLGPGFVHRVHQNQQSFTWFLQPGSAEFAPAASASLSAAVIMELGFRTVRRRTGIHMRAFLPTATYVALTPLIGPKPAREFIQHQTGRL